MEHKDTQVVQTCWATMALMYAKYPHPEPIERAVKLVMSRQRAVSLLAVLVTRVRRMTDWIDILGWLVAAGSDRGCVQQERCNLVPEL